MIICLGLYIQGPCGDFHIIKLHFLRVDRSYIMFSLLMNIEA